MIQVLAFILAVLSVIIGEAMQDKPPQALKHELLPQRVSVVELRADAHVSTKPTHKIVLTFALHNNASINSNDIDDPDSLWLSCMVRGRAYDTMTNEYLGTYDRAVVFQADWTVDENGKIVAQVVPPGKTQEIDFLVSVGANAEQLKRSESFIDCKPAARETQAWNMRGLDPIEASSQAKYHWRTLTSAGAARYQMSNN